METIKDMVTGSGYSLDDVRRDLLRQGAKEIGASHNIARGGDTDIFIGGARYLIFQSDADDVENYAKLKRDKVPLLSDNPVHLKGWMFALPIPLSTLPLDNRAYPEQSPTEGGHIGAFEIMKEAGLLLSKVKESTGSLPEGFGLSKLALINGEEDFLRIIPPIKLSPNLNIDEIAKNIFNELNTSDPYNKHSTQARELASSFKNHNK